MRDVFRAYKTELAPNREQAETLAQWCEVSRRVYNWALRGREYHYETTGETLTHYDQDKAFTQFKKLDEGSFLRDVSRRVIYYALRDLDMAFKHFFRRVKQGGGKPGYPRLHHQARSFTVYGSDIRVSKDRLRLPLIGWIRLKEKAYIPDLLDSYGECTVSMRAGRWFVSVVCVDVIPERTASGPSVAAHPGVRQFLTVRRDDGDETRFENRRSTELYRKRLARLQRKLSRQKKGSNNREKTKDKIAKTHYRIACIRSDATHKATHAVAKMAPRHIVIQAWKVRDMLEADTDLPKWLERQIKRGIADANFSEMLRQIRYKVDWHGSDVIEVDASAPMSKRCSICGEIHEALGMEQVFRCPHCGYEADRETNATKNLLQELEPALSEA